MRNPVCPVPIGEMLRHEGSELYSVVITLHSSLGEQSFPPLLRREPGNGCGREGVVGSHCGDRCRGCMCPGVPTSQTVFGPLLRSYGVQPKRFMSLPRSQLSRDDTDTCILTVSTNRVGPTYAPSRLQPQNRTANARNTRNSRPYVPEIGRWHRVCYDARRRRRGRQRV